MLKKFTTNLDEEDIEWLKIEAIKRGTTPAKMLAEMIRKEKEASQK